MAPAARQLPPLSATSAAPASRGSGAEEAREGGEGGGGRLRMRAGLERREAAGRESGRRRRSVRWGAEFPFRAAAVPGGVRNTSVNFSEELRG